MRSLYPVPAADVDLLDAYGDARPQPDGRPWVLANMVTSADGAVTVGGRSGRLGGAADRELFQVLRGIADVVVAGAGTVRAEHYGPPRTPPELQAWREAHGKPPFPRLAVVSGRLNLDADTPLFTDSPTRPIVITSASADAARKKALGEVADVIGAGEGEVDLGAALSTLGAGGAELVTVEGGPTLNGHLLAADLLDELCLSLAPVLVAGTSARAAHSDEEAVRRMELTQVLEDEGMLFCRYRRRGD